MLKLIDLISDNALPVLIGTLAVFGFTPGFVLRMIVLLYPKGDPRRRELVAELYMMRRIERPMWVAEQIETGLFEGIGARRRARRSRRAYVGAGSAVRASSQRRVILAGTTAAAATALGTFAIIMNTTFTTGAVVTSMYATPGTIEPGSDALLHGTVSGLPQGHSLWLLSKPSSEVSDYFVVMKVPVAPVDGTWTAVDRSVGDIGDRGSSVSYLAVDADAYCSDGLIAESSVIGFAGRARTIPTGCRISGQKATVKFSE